MDIECALGFLSKACAVVVHFSSICAMLITKQLIIEYVAKKLSTMQYTVPIDCIVDSVYTYCCFRVPSSIIFRLSPLSCDYIILHLLDYG